MIPEHSSWYALETSGAITLCFKKMSNSQYSAECFKIWITGYYLFIVLFIGNHAILCWHGSKQLPEERSPLSGHTVGFQHCLFYWVYNLFHYYLYNFYLYMCYWKTSCYTFNRVSYSMASATQLVYNVFWHSGGSFLQETWWWWWWCHQGFLESESELSQNQTQDFKYLTVVLADASLCSYTYSTLSSNSISQVEYCEHWSLFFCFGKYKCLTQWWTGTQG